MIQDYYLITDGLACGIFVYSASSTDHAGVCCSDLPHPSLDIETMADPLQLNLVSASHKNFSQLSQPHMHPAGLCLTTALFALCFSHLSKPIAWKWKSHDIFSICLSVCLSPLLVSMFQLSYRHPKT